jgi:hypothetical protein
MFEIIIFLVMLPIFFGYGYLLLWPASLLGWAGFHICKHKLSHWIQGHASRRGSKLRVATEARSEVSNLIAKPHFFSVRSARYPYTSSPVLFPADIKVDTSKNSSPEP